MSPQKASGEPCGAKCLSTPLPIVRQRWRTMQDSENDRDALEMSKMCDDEQTYEDFVSLFPGSKKTYNVGVMASLKDEQFDKLADIVIFLRLNDLKSIDVVVFDVTSLRKSANKFGFEPIKQARV